MAKPSMAARHSYDHKLFVAMKVRVGLDISETLAVHRKKPLTVEMSTSIIPGRNHERSESVRCGKKNDEGV